MTGQESPVNGSVTLLVVPLPLLKNWQSELKFHLRPDNLKWRIYHGPARFRPRDENLGCDVITTYDIVTSEYKNLNRVPGLLFSTHWHRVILDEGAPSEKHYRT